ncbi:hypothetical protein ACH4XT_25435 [Streptomyces avidinii]|uniref:hypothetical protein n=1 Tax=Streptomyces avidinii TaxID=1895 RepID=UPI0037A32003
MTVGEDGSLCFCIRAADGSEAEAYPHLPAGMRDGAVIVELTGEAVEAALTRPRRPSGEADPQLSQPGRTRPDS